ncbi:restriction endonuclease subunit S [Idiomarina piscisalsi]|uniref:Restriction endonuclease subunit S n=1 Tax=Idiomarina piscisalsi TaxID=1096243 RepID=A0ABM6LW35_9GAMM|nr:restriction endonuclease subunit S [Idiomarina piscisalsi]ASG66816.1 restriction endonuclease subunit S [Idiomarina piscisalsi]
MTQLFEMKRIAAIEFCSSVRDGTHDSPRFHENGYPLITSKNIKGGRLVIENANQISEKDFVDINKRSGVEQWDILFTMIGTLGEVYLEKESEVDYAIKNVGLFKCGSELKGKWLYYWFKTPLNKKKVLQLRRGASQQYLPLGALRSLQIDFPTDSSFAERAIKFISSYDDLIENNKRRIALLEESARQLYKEWFVRFRFPGHEHVKIVDGVPEGWEKSSVADAVSINPKTPVDKGEEIKYVPMSSLSSSQMTVDTSKFELRSKHTNVKFKSGDTLLARITPCLENGKTAFVSFLKEEEVACGSTEFIILRAKKVSAEYTYLLSRDEHFRGFAIKSMVGSSGRQRVQKSCFDKFFIAVPPSAIQHQFNEIASRSFRQIANLEHQVGQLERARDLLLPRLMSGELAV